MIATLDLIVSFDHDSNAFLDDSIASCTSSLLDLYTLAITFDVDGDMTGMWDDAVDDVTVGSLRTP